MKEDRSSKYPLKDEPPISILCMQGENAPSFAMASHSNAIMINSPPSKPACVLCFFSRIYLRANFEGTRRHLYDRRELKITLKCVPRKLSDSSLYRRDGQLSWNRGINLPLISEQDFRVCYESNLRVQIFNTDLLLPDMKSTSWKCVKQVHQKWNKHNCAAVRDHQVPLASSCLIEATASLATPVVSSWLLYCLYGQRCTFQFLCQLITVNRFPTTRVQIFYIKLRRRSKPPCIEHWG